jgi:hypothetical protein
MSLTFTRGQYGEITSPSEPFALFHDLLRRAFKAEKLQAPFRRFDKRGRGTALSYDLYDVRGSTILVQQRETEVTKWGTAPTKEYFILKAVGKGVAVTQVDKKHLIVKQAKAGAAPGTILDVLEGRAQRRLGGVPRTVYEAWRVMEKAEDGTLRSCFDGSEWHLGKARRDKAQEGHRGGFYWYNSEAKCRQAALERNGIIRKAHREGLHLVVVECEAWGKTLGYPDFDAIDIYPTKHCSTYVRPLRIVGALVEPEAQEA